MTKTEERRQCTREDDPQFGLGIAIWQTKDSAKTVEGSDQCCCFVGICNQSDDGLMVESPQPIDAEQSLIIKYYNFKEKIWQDYESECVWSERIEDTVCHSGLRVKQELSSQESCLEASSPLNRIIENLEFFLTLPLLKYWPRKNLWVLLNCLTPCDVPDGEQFITQGDEANSLFIIEKGTGQVSIDKDGEKIILTQLGPRDLVGEMALLTGEPRVANFTALEDMILWKLDKVNFDQAISRFSELRTFLTELLSNRLEASTHATDRIVGKYIAKRKLGTGAWAIVYQGLHQALNKTIAIKMLKHQMAMDEEFSAKFIKEAEIIAGMNHPNIVHVYDIESLYATHFIIMEYLEGESLKQVLKRTGMLSPEQTVTYLLQICAGLDYAHNLDIVHQDIKPDNILVQGDGTVKILDFGLACPTGSENFEMEGTIQYMSPEQIDSYPVDARTDIYCLGITAFEMITGLRPFPDEDLMDMINQRLSEDIASPAAFRSGLPERLCQFIMKACSRKAKDRFQNVQEAITELEILAQEIGLHDIAVVRQHMSSLFLFYTEEQRAILAELLEEFSTRASQSGIRMQLADFENVTAS